ncbi:MAG TPA: HAD-IA family hydrolase [Acidimicrobiales bacterium]|nr:HAD-IA family hydrolase [Acidimicrobiales bacterium]
MSATEVVVCDLDGTLIDSDEALADAYVALGVPRHEITYGHVVAEECARWGVSVDDYVAAYDTTTVRPFAGVEELVAALGRWVIVSNKRPEPGRAELDRLGWRPEQAWFADAFDGPKRLEPVLEDLGVAAASVVFVGDTDHDRACARAVGCRFVLAGWNPRAQPVDGDLVATHPGEVLTFL